MRIKIIGDNDCARATRNLLRQAGFAVTEFLPADALVNGPHAGYAITIDSTFVPESGTSADSSATSVIREGTTKSASLPYEGASANDLLPANLPPPAVATREVAATHNLAPAHPPDTAPVHTAAGGLASTPDPATHQLAATHTGEASAHAKAAADASSPASFETTAGRPACVGAHNLIHFDSVDSALEAAILRHVTQLSTLPVIVDRPGGQVRSERELRIVVPCGGDDTRTGGAAAVAVEFGILRGLLDLTSPVAAAEKSVLDPHGSSGPGRRKWWHVLPAIVVAVFLATLSSGGNLLAVPGGGDHSNPALASNARNLSEVSRAERPLRDSSAREAGLGMTNARARRGPTNAKVVARPRGYWLTAFGDTDPGSPKTLSVSEMSVSILARRGKGLRAAPSAARRPAAAQGQFPYSSTGTVTHTVGALTSGHVVTGNAGALEFSTQDQLTAIGNNALNANTTGSYDTAVGAGVEAYSTTASYNTGIGNSSLGGSSLTGSYNTGIGPLTLLGNTSGNENVAISLEALYANTTGSGNTAIGYAAGYTATTANANTSGSDNTWIGTQAGPGTTTQLTNSLALGYQALNTASNQSVVGNSSTTSFIPYGTVSVNSGKPAASAGTITGTDNGGYIAGLSAATTVTITFANGWSTWASCAANTSAASTQPYVSAISKTAVTFTFASLTGTVYYHCDGQ